MKYSGFFVNIAAFLIIIFAIVYVLIRSKFILLPLIFAMLFALVMLVIVRRIERLIPYTWLSIILGMISVFAPVAIVIFLLSAQFTQIVTATEVSSLQTNNLATQIEEWIEPYWVGNEKEASKWLSENVSSLVKGPIQFIQNSLSTSFTFFTQLGLFFIFSFLFLLYRGGIKSFILTQFSKEAQEETYEVIQSILQVIQGYLSGMLLVILILSTLNSIGLWIIGIPYPLFWGILGGTLALIPYIGTWLGGLLPFAYSFFIMDFWWQPLAVILMYSAVQTLEGNIITPVVVGDRVRINVLFALLALLIGNAIWGVAGMVLALPITAMLKVILYNISYTKPFAVLMGSEIATEGPQMHHTFAEAKYRLSTLFVNQNKK